MNKSAINDLGFLTSNRYWGRGILIGTTADKIAVAYFIMGRSENSRNRYFFMEDTNIVIAPFDESKVEDPSLIIYYPIRLCGTNLIVTNGDQTDTICEYIKAGLTFEDALRTRNFEPDGPNFTPRISGLVDCVNGDYKLSILKNIDGAGERCGRYFYEYEPVDGTGRFIHTYESDGNPLPSFEGEPWTVSIPDDFSTFTNTIWTSLDDDNKISHCTMFLDRESKDFDIRILNKRMGD